MEEFFYKKTVFGCQGIFCSEKGSFFCCFVYNETGMTGYIENSVFDV